jgi:tetratricopeptide (TPR) repeat protein
MLALALLPLAAVRVAGQEAGPPIDALLARGETALRDGRVDEARSLFLQAQAIDPESPRIWNLLGGVSFVERKFEEALERFDKAAKGDPRNPRILNNLGTTYERLGKPAEALEQYLASIAADPGYAEAFRNLGAIYAYRLRDTTLAVHYWTKYLELAPDGPGSRDVREEMQRLGGGVR